MGGGYGQLLHWDGSALSVVPLAATAGYVLDLFGFSPTDLWAVGSSILHWDGKIWSIYQPLEMTAWNAVWGSAPDDVWMVGDRENYAHWDGASWTTGALLRGTSWTLFSLWGTGPGNLWAVGLNSTIMHLRP